MVHGKLNNQTPNKHTDEYNTKTRSYQKLNIPIIKMIWIIIVSVLLKDFCCEYVKCVSRRDVELILIKYPQMESKNQKE